MTKSAEPDESPNDVSNRNQPSGTRSADDALPQTPKYKSLDKMHYSVSFGTCLKYFLV